MVAAYQLLAQKRRVHPQLRAFAPPAPKPLPLFARLRKHCTTFFNTGTPSASTQTRSDEEKAFKTHRSLRSFHLFNSNEKRGCDDTPRRTPLRLSMGFMSSNSKAPRPRPRPSSWRTSWFPSAYTHTHSHHSYSQLDVKDSDLLNLVRPDAAVLSPWSPLEDNYPPTPASPTPRLRSFLLRGAGGGTAGSEPGTPLLSPPPAAYLNTTTQRPTTPLRPTRPARPDGLSLLTDVAGLSPTKTSSSSISGSALLSPTPTLADSDSDAGWEKSVDGETCTEVDVVDSDQAKKLMDEIQLVLEFTRDRSKDDSHLGKFVIADDVSEEVDLDEVSLYSNK